MCVCERERATYILMHVCEKIKLAVWRGRERERMCMCDCEMLSSTQQIVRVHAGERGESERERGRERSNGKKSNEG